MTHTAKEELKAASVHAEQVKDWAVANLGVLIVSGVGLLLILILLMALSNCRAATM